MHQFNAVNLAICAVFTIDRSKCRQLVSHSQNSSPIYRVRCNLWWGSAFRTIIMVPFHEKSSIESQPYASHGSASGIRLRIGLLHRARHKVEVTSTPWESKL